MTSMRCEWIWPAVLCSSDDSCALASAGAKTNRAQPLRHAKAAIQKQMTTAEAALVIEKIERILPVLYAFFEPAGQTKTLAQTLALRVMRNGAKQS